MQSQAPAGSMPQPTPHDRYSMVELPAGWQEGDNVNGPANTQFRHEMPVQYPPQSFQQPRPPWTQFSIATEGDSLSSGFPYSERLLGVGVTPDQWASFTREVVEAAKLTLSEDVAAWSAGVSTGAASSPFLLVFGPVVGYYTGRSVHRKTLVKKVKEKLSQDTELRSVLRLWNDGVFKERGLQAWLDTPTDSGQVTVDLPPGTNPKDIAKVAKQQAKRFRIMIMPWDPRNSPVGSTSSTQQSPVSPMSDNGKWNYQQFSPGQTPSPMFNNGKWSPQQISVQNKPPIQPGWKANQQTIQPPAHDPSRIQELPSGPFPDEYGAQTLVELDGGVKPDKFANLEQQEAL